MRVAHIYPDLLGLYGDRGNIMCLKHRCEARGIPFTVDNIGVGLPFNESDYDLIFIGGGQDFDEEVLLDDLSKGKDVKIKKAVNDSTAILAICGGFQMLGKYYETAKGDRMDFIGALDFYTKGAEKRMIGNYLYNTDFGTVVGFENHSGRTYLQNCEPLGKVVSGFGNNGEDHTEGARYKNTFCTYSHGPVLPKNPNFADELITAAMVRSDPSFVLKEIDDNIEINAKNQTISLYFSKFIKK